MLGLGWLSLELLNCTGLLMQSVVALACRSWMSPMRKDERMLDNEPNYQVLPGWSYLELHTLS